jgi:hypothetical protein
LDLNSLRGNGFKMVPKKENLKIFNVFRTLWQAGGFSLSFAALFLIFLIQN